MNKSNSIRGMLPEQRPDEKFLAFGPEALTDAELLAIILRTGTGEESCIELADRILSLGQTPGKSLLNLYDCGIEDLMELKGIGKVKAVKLKAVAELSKRIAMTNASTSLSFRCPETIAAYYMEQLRHEKREHVLLLMLDSACHLIGEVTISLGTVNTAPLSPREIFLEALKYSAVNIVLIHNHPSGDPTPSKADIKSTARVKKTGSILGIELLDHIIVGDRDFVSLKSEGFLD